MLIKKDELEAFKEMMLELAQQDSPFSLGKIDPNYTSGLPKIVFDGETIASSKKYAYLGSYVPIANDRVLLSNIGGSHVVLGGVVTDPLINVWQNATLASGFSNYGYGYSPAQYKKTGRNTIMLRGLIIPPSTFSTGTIFTLPVGYRPKSHDIYSGEMKKSDGSLSLWQFTVYSDGRVQAEGFTGSSSNLAWLSLSGIEIDLG